MKNINEMSNEEIKAEINKLRNMTDEERNLEMEKLKKEYEQFKEETAPEILKILEEKRYRVDVCCQGLVIIIRALLQNFGTKQMLQDCLQELQRDMDDLPGIDLEDLGLEE